MCSFSSEQSHFFLVLPRSCSSKKHLHLGQFNRRRTTQLKEARQRKRMVVVKAKIKMKNLKLYMENQTIIEENEKLRKQARLLHKENQALMSEFQKKLSEKNNTNNN